MTVKVGINTLYVVFAEMVLTLDDQWAMRLNPKKNVKNDWITNNSVGSKLSSFDNWKSPGGTKPKDVNRSNKCLGSVSINAFGWTIPIIDVTIPPIE